MLLALTFSSLEANMTNYPGRAFYYPYGVSRDAESVQTIFLTHKSGILCVVFRKRRAAKSHGYEFRPIKERLKFWM